MKAKIDRKINLDKAAEIMKALGHPIRIQMVELISQKGKFCVSDIYKTLKMEQSTASHHLGILRKGGVLKTERKGKQIYYLLNGDNYYRLLDCIQACSCK